MILKTDVTVEKKAWDEQLKLLGGKIFHSSDWAEYQVEGKSNVKPYFLTLYRESTNEPVLGVALALLSRSSRPVLSHISGRLLLDSTPAIRDNDPETLFEFFKALVSFAKSLNVVELFVGSYASRYGRECLDRLEAVITKRLEFEIDLREPEDRIWSRISNKRKACISKAIEHGIELRSLDRKNAACILCSLQSESGRRIRKRGGPDVIYSERGEADPVIKLLNSGSAEVKAAFLKEEPLSVALFTFFNGLVYNTLAGHSDKGLKLNAGSLLYWESIREYRLRGGKSFNFGGCRSEAIDEASPEHGVYIFKKSFGANIIECTSGLKIMRPVTSAVMRLILHT